MLKRLCLVGLFLSTAVIPQVYGQKSTEIFVPIGKSPGVSGKYSVIGKIDSIDRAASVVTISGEGGNRNARITERTKIWLDKHELKQKSEAGSPADCQIGRQCEVKYVYKDGTATDEAEWIKIRVSGSN